MARFQPLAISLLSALCSYQVDAARLRSLAQIPFLPGHRHLATCALTEDVDYIGNDIKHVKGAQASDCCVQCSLTPNCGTFTWMNFEFGTCWLKTAKGNTAPNPGARSAEFVADSPSCSLKDGVDYQGNDIANVKSTNAEGCCSICSTWAGCNAFTWSNFNGGTCWLKSTKGPEVSKAGVKSSEVKNTVNQCRLQNNVDFVDNDIGSALSDNPGACCDICKNWNGCRAFSWSDHNGGTCWPKSAMGATEVKFGAVSSSLLDNLPQSCTLESSMNYVANDLANVWAAKPGDCCALCRAQRFCRVFSWSNYQVGAGLRKVIFRGYTVLSKRKLQWFVDRGRVEDWVAPRSTTV
ncbi:hypothetical protein BBO99_00008384 [Phytophthora kernoviae]|uniref:Apple domain-containing protein n=1 Tax=Phytophthora kernoviae TaxID=325452 RepID=A0A3R7HDZ2_9STRA|nr:hypothetical protein BBI17_008340 [Phytophthora kernoviae]RLN75365.1 hypothetical protein BBO99_00008384 [Phytophthora kernoviae]